MKAYPALNVRSPLSDILLSTIDDFAATAVEERDESVRVFFSTADAREAAGGALAAAGFSVEPIDVDDEDWARRSQDALQPITVGRITVAPPWAARLAPVTGLQPLTIVIQPSMGFGTGHHATTRLCLAALQSVDVSGRVVLDVGTGSGVLAIAAARLGAAHVVALDDDPDAIQSARENIGLNPEAADVDLRLADVTAIDLPSADVVTANLTGALLVRTSTRLMTALRPGGTLIASGLLADERDDVCRAFGVIADPDEAQRASIIWEQHADEWVGMALRHLPGV